MADSNQQHSAPNNVQLVRASEFFDAKYYKRRNREAIVSGVDPVKHYLSQGALEGRDPSEAFSTSGYLDRYPDVRASGWNPLVHFLRLGQAEGRSANPLVEDRALVRDSELFDELYYRHLRPDLPETTDPVDHYLRHGAGEGADPSEAFSTRAYLRTYPDVVATKLNPLVHYLRHGRTEGRQIAEGKPLSGRFRRLYDARFENLAPIPILRVTGVGPRVTVLTDSVGATSLFGGVGTALILGVQLANRLGATLRLATRNDPPDPTVLLPLQQANGVALLGDVEIVHLPTDGATPLLMGERDVVITTSWWTTRAALDSTLHRDELIYLLQEDERMFYPFGDERLLCSELLDERDLTVVVNTHRLLDHLALSYPHLDSEAISFEPAFPGAANAITAETTAERTDGRRNFFFYSRPENSRNLFWRGGAAIAAAIEEHILDPEIWDFHFVGRATPNLVLPHNTKPHIIEGLDWRSYQALVARMDSALVLMDTPHPSYPPLDLAAAGAAVLTNTHPGKDDLSGLSGNILISSPLVDDLVEGLTRVAALGQDDEARQRNVASDTIARDWSATMSDVVEALHARVGVRMAAGRGHVR